MLVSELYLVHKIAGVGSFPFLCVCTTPCTVSANPNRQSYVILLCQGWEGCAGQSCRKQENQGSVFCSSFITSVFPPANLGESQGLDCWVCSVFIVMGQCLPVGAFEVVFYLRFLSPDKVLRELIEAR